MIEVLVPRFLLDRDSQTLRFGHCPAQIFRFGEVWQDAIGAMNLQSDGGQGLAAMSG